VDLRGRGYLTEPQIGKKNQHKQPACISIQRTKIGGRVFTRQVRDRPIKAKRGDRGGACYFLPHRYSWLIPFFGFTSKEKEPSKKSDLNSVISISTHENKANKTREENRAIIYRGSGG
jgi:hypothetical protein